MGEISLGMASRFACRRRERQDRRNRKKAGPNEASRGAKVLHPGSQAAIGRMREIRIPAFAKINLRLDILGKRPDGYHELRTIFQTVSLHDELRLRRSRNSGISVNIRGNEALSREPLRKNLVYAAIDALRHELKVLSVVAIELYKTITYR